MTSMNPQALPPMFVSHGSPMTALEPREAGAYWQALGPALERRFQRPKAILAVSAHTLMREPVLLAAARHPTVHDFSGFPDELYRLNWDAPGAPALAPRVAELLRGAGLPAHLVPEGGMDHGIWAPLRFMWPDPTIPVLPLGFPPNWTPAKLFAMGEALAPLVDEGVWIMGSGSLTHNLRLVFAAGGMPPVDAPEMPQSAAFRQWWAQKSAAADWEALFDYRRQAPHGALMHPTDEHLLPWFVAAGAGGRGAATVSHESLTYGCLAMDAYAFGPQAPALQAELAA